MCLLGQSNCKGFIWYFMLGWPGQAALPMEGGMSAAAWAAGAVCSVYALAGCTVPTASKSNLCS
jgi:hypothetical protein